MVSCYLIILLQYWFGIGSFIGGDATGNFRLSWVTLAPVPDKRETPVDILDSNNISVGADGSNWLIKFDVLFNFCVLMDYLVIFSF